MIDRNKKGNEYLRQDVKAKPTILIKKERKFSKASLPLSLTDWEETSSVVDLPFYTVF